MNGHNGVVSGYPISTGFLWVDGRHSLVSEPRYEIT